MIRIALLLIALLAGTLRPAGAVTAVNPFGVNVRASGPTTVFLTFQSLDPAKPRSRRSGAANCYRR